MSDASRGSPRTPIRIFCSYAHEDEPFCHELDKHLKLSQFRNEIQLWHDRKIPPGAAWADHIDRNLEEAEIILLLVSPDFFASDYCIQIEMSRALKRHEEGTARVVPVFIRHYHWQDAPFGHLQGVPKDAVPIAAWPDRDGAWTDVTRRILAEVAELQGARESVAGYAALRQAITYTKFVHAQIVAKGLLDLEASVNPYESFSDPTECWDSDPLARIFTFLWLPATQKIRTPQLQPFLPAVAISVLNPDRIAQVFAGCVGPAKLPTLLKTEFKDLYPDNQELFIRAIGTALADSFIAALTIPSLVLSVGKTDPELAYHAILDLLLLPLLAIHSRLGFARFHLRLSPVGEQEGKLIGRTAKILKAHYPKKDTSSVQALHRDDPWYAIIAMAKFLAWAVTEFHSGETDAWIQKVEKSFLRNGKGSPLSAEPPPLTSHASGSAT